MKKKFFILVISLLSLESAVLTSLADTVTNSTNVNTGIKPPAAAQRPKIYDENADGSEQITEALAVAKKEGKHVLLQFGANWCIWCHRLHQLEEKNTDVSAALKKDYVLVLIDVNKDHNKAVDEKYDHPTQHGLPVLVVLDADGKKLITQDTGSLEEKDHHSPEKVVKFLKEWAPKK